MNLANSSIRTFSLLDSKNALIFSTVSLSSEFSSQISVIPCTLATLGASFHVDIENWRTDERTCSFLRFPLVADSQKNGQQTYQVYPIYAFTTAESTMSFEELQQRSIVYFRLCQALLQPTEFRPPWSCHMQTLSVAPSYLISILCTAERLFDQSPHLLHHCYPHYPPININKLEGSQNCPSRLASKFIAQSHLEQETADILLGCKQVIFINSQVLGVFSGSAYDEQLQDCKQVTLDSLDIIVLMILQKDDQFMKGTDSKFTYEVTSTEKSTALLTHLKRVINDVADADFAVETQLSAELAGKRILQLRINNKLMSCVVIFQPIDIMVENPPQCNICYIFPINTQLHQMLRVQCNNQLPELIKQCDGLISTHMKDYQKVFAKTAELHCLNAQNPERGFSLRYQISSFPGLFYMSVKNLSRGSILAPDLQMEPQMRDIHDQDPEYPIPAAPAQQFQQGRQSKHRPYTEPPTTLNSLQQPQKHSPVLVIDQDMNQQQIVAQIFKQLGVARTQVQKLLQLEHQALRTGITYTIERDDQFARIFWIFYYNTHKDTDSQATIGRTSQLNQQFKQLWDGDAQFYPLPLSRQQLADLSRTEGVVPGKRTEYNQCGGYVGTPQYWQSVDALSRENKLFKKENRPGYELFEVQAVFLNLVSIDDIRNITNELFRKFLELVWSDPY